MKEKNGITLIALIITIIVMLILVAVTINVAINGGIFRRAKEATEKTQIEADKESLLMAAMACIGEDGIVDFTELNKEAAKLGFSGSNGTYSKGGYTYIVNKTTGKVTLAGTSTSEDGGGSETTESSMSTVEYDDLTQDLKDAIDLGKVSSVVKQTINGEEIIAVIPTGYTISSDENENKISKGLVISDTNGNEFVWIPVPEKNMQSSYEQWNATEPTELTDIDINNSGETYDSPEEITYYYGSTLSYEDDFNYAGDYAEMVASVNKYGGFYIGRYETTIDSSNNIGSKVNTEVLTANKELASLGNHPARWWGLYYAQRRTNVAGLGTNVQTNMIWGQQWDKMLEYFDNNNIDYSEIEVQTLSTSEEVVNSGQAKYSYNNNTISDIIYNIYDLRGNAYDWTAEAESTDNRILRGGNYVYRAYASERYQGLHGLVVPADYYCSRATLYIK